MRIRLDTTGQHHVIPAGYFDIEEQKPLIASYAGKLLQPNAAWRWDAYSLALQAAYLPRCLQLAIAARIMRATASSSLTISSLRTPLQPLLGKAWYLSQQSGAARDHRRRASTCLPGVMG